MTNFKKSILAGLVFSLGIYLTIKENWVLALIVDLFSAVALSIGSYKAIPYN